MPRSSARRFAGVLLACASFAHAQTPPAPVDPAEAPAAPKFEIRRFAVEGNTILPRDEVDSIVAPFTGRDKDFGSVQQALEALQDAYLARGYNAVRVSIPEQDLVGGQVTLQVIEARIREVRVEQNRYFNADNVRASVPSLRAGQPPNARRIGDNMQLANENPAKQSTVRLEATDKIGDVDAVVRVTDENPSRFTLFLDNTGNAQTGQLRLGAGYQHANLFNRDQVLNVQVITSPENANDVAIVGAGYRVPVYGWNGAFEVFAGYSDVDSGTVQDLFAVSGKGSIFGARYSQILPRVDAYEHKVVLGYDYREFKQHVGDIGDPQSTLPDILVQPVSISYLGRYSRVGSDLSFSLSAATNIPGGKDGTEFAFDQNRPSAQPEYSVYRFGINYTRLLPFDFLFRFNVSGQYTQDPLVPGEQFGIGGADSVRGFFEREVSYDRGVRGTVELYSPDLSWLADWRFRVLTFYDSGRGEDVELIRNPPEGLDSAGVGMRINRGRALFFRADWAYAINGTGSFNGNVPTRPSGTDRWHVAVGVTF